MIKNELRHKKKQSGRSIKWTKGKGSNSTRMINRKAWSKTPKGSYNTCHARRAWHRCKIGKKFQDEKQNVASENRKQGR